METMGEKTVYIYIDRPRERRTFRHTIPRNKKVTTPPVQDLRSQRKFRIYIHRAPFHAMQGPWSSLCGEAAKPQDKQHRHEKKNEKT